MKFYVINGSPKGNNSITLHTLYYLEKLYPEHIFEYVNVGQQIKYLLTTCFTCTVIFFLCISIERLITLDGYYFWQLIFRGVICFSVSNIMFFFIYRDTEEYHSAKIWIHNVIKRFKGKKV